MEDIHRMAVYRGCELAKTQPRGGRNVVLYDVTAKNHPRHGSQLLALLDTSDEFSKAAMVASMNHLSAVIKQTPLAERSSIVYVHPFAIDAKRIKTATSVFSQITKLHVFAKNEWHFEMIPLAHLTRNWELPRYSRNWRIVSGDECEWVAAGAIPPHADVRRLDGGGMVIDRPPLIADNDPWAIYIGARVDDYVMYESLIDGEVGPMWHHAMRLVVGPRDLAEDEADASSSESESDEPSD